MKSHIIAQVYKIWADKIYKQKQNSVCILCMKVCVKVFLNNITEHPVGYISVSALCVLFYNTYQINLKFVNVLNRVLTCCLVLIYGQSLEK